jgi:hypothetical protein
VLELTRKEAKDKTTGKFVEGGVGLGQCEVLSRHKTVASGTKVGEKVIKEKDVEREQ